MTLEVSTPALLFPAISLLFLSFTNRFLHLAALIRSLHRDWRENHDEVLLVQIDNIRHRLRLIRWMQLLGAFSLLFSVISMLTIVAGIGWLGSSTFVCALSLMAGSLTLLAREILLSGGALQVLLNAMEGERQKEQ